ncbi:MAG: hypothetical protein HHJ16_08055, partial [Polaromonas sp.]|uniref:flagellar hook-length control protein FliK n=1 Tax=Polaromonas sp. TaxID=1869339 RepID=UPI00184F803F
SRSRAPAGKTTEKPTVKPPLTALARRQAAGSETLPDNLITAVSVPFIPLENRFIQATPTGGAGTAADGAASSSASPPLTSLLATSAVPTDGSVAASEVAMSTNAPSSLATTLLAPPPKDVGRATRHGPPSPVTVDDSSTISLDAMKTVEIPAAPEIDLHPQSSKRDSKPANKSDGLREVAANLAPATLHGAAKAGTTVAPPPAAVADPTRPTPPAPDAATSSANAVLPAYALNAATHGSGGVSSPNPATATATAMASLSLSPAVGSSDWGKALGHQMIQMGNAGHQVAELQLNPPGLGPLKVTLSLSDQQIQAVFVSAHSSVRAALEAALPQLRTTLADSGISLGNTSISAENQQQASFAQSQSRNSDSRSYRNNSMVKTETLSIGTVSEPLRRSNGISVDTYA